MKSPLCVALACVTFVLATYDHSYAQSMFVGYDVFCGLPVVVGPDPQIASARTDAFGGKYIHVDPAAMANWTASRMFALAHECAHHLLRHSTILGAIQRYSGGTARQELEADCWAAMALRRIGHDFEITRTILERAQEGHFAGPGYPTGIQRAHNLLTCMLASEVGEPRPDIRDRRPDEPQPPEPARDVRRTSAFAFFRVLANNAVTGVDGIGRLRGPDDGRSNWIAAREVPDGWSDCAFPRLRNPDFSTRLHCTVSKDATRASASRVFESVHSTLRDAIEQRNWQVQVTPEGWYSVDYIESAQWVHPSSQAQMILDLYRTGDGLFTVALTVYSATPVLNLRNDELVVFADALTQGPHTLRNASTEHLPGVYECMPEDNSYTLIECTTAGSTTDFETLHQTLRGSLLDVGWVDASLPPSASRVSGYLFRHSTTGAVIEIELIRSERGALQGWLRASIGR